MPVNRAGFQDVAELSLSSICLDRETQIRLEQALRRSSFIVLGHSDRYITNDRDLHLVRGSGDINPRVVVVDFDQNRAEAMQTAERIRKHFGNEVYIFAASVRTEPEFIISAMRCGCTEYLVKPLSPDKLGEALAAVESKLRDNKRPGKHGRVVTILGAKGGAGVTSVAAHLAIYLSAQRQKALLVDQHSSLGDVSLYLGLHKSQYTYHELVNNTDRLDEDLLQGFLQHHSSGVDVLDSPEPLESLPHLAPEAIEHTLEFLTGLYQFVIVDCPPGLADSTLATIQRSDTVVLVATAELPAVRNLARYIEHLARLEYPAEQIQVAINRHSKKSTITDDQIEKAIRRPISVRIPNSYMDVSKAINAGIPILPDRRSEFGTAFEVWATSLVNKRPKPVPIQKKESSTLFQSLGLGRPLGEGGKTK